MVCEMVGVAGFEPTTPTPPVWCATRLRYTPIDCLVMPTIADWLGRVKGGVLANRHAGFEVSQASFGFF